jgi:carbamoylphosphate synthase large subunit
MTNRKYLYKIYNDIKYYIMKILLPHNEKWQYVLRKKKGLKFTKFRDNPDFFDYCERKHIEYIFPLATGDTYFLNDNAKKLRYNGYKFLVSPTDTVKMLANKSRFVDFMIDNKLQKYIPEKYKSIQYPCILKKNRSIFGQDSYVIKQPSDIPRNIDIKKDYLIQEVIPGKCEYTTDILAKNGNIIMHTTLKYCYKDEVYIMGINLLSTGHLENMSADVYNVFEKIIKKLNYSGFCNIDYKITSDGTPKIFEINPRCGGSLKNIGRKNLYNFIEKYTEYSY